MKTFRIKFRSRESTEAVKCSSEACDSEELDSCRHSNTLDVNMMTLEKLVIYFNKLPQSETGCVEGCEGGGLGVEPDER